MKLSLVHRITCLPVLAMTLTTLFFSSLSLASKEDVYSEEYFVARLWNETLLASIRADYARPTVHARNLFHVSVVMYDAWAAYDDVATTYLLGKSVGGYSCSFDRASLPIQANKKAQRRESISYAAYRLLSHRFKCSPGIAESQTNFDRLFSDLGYDSKFISTDYSSGSAAALGNHIARCMIAFGLQDGANEKHGYVPLAYRPVNPPLAPSHPGTPRYMDPNRWQPLALKKYIDQSGHEIPCGAVEFIGPEWGRVAPFALNKEDAKVFKRKGFEYWVYHDPGAPPQLDVEPGGGSSDEYKWNFSLVSVWSSHLDPADGVAWDISPGAMGNVQSLPKAYGEVQKFYDVNEGVTLAEAGRKPPVPDNPINRI